MSTMAASSPVQTWPVAMSVAAVAEPLPADGHPAAPAATTAGIEAPASPAPASQAFQSGGSGAGSVGGALVALLLVVGLIFALAWLARRMPGLGGATGNRNLKLVGSLSIGPRERVVVVDVGGTQLLLSTGAGGTRTLHTLAQPLPEPDGGGPSPFAQVLAQQFGKKKTA